ncbi:hypothetical protein PR003_g21573 [Phytophthora rubi]|uniref:Uncharacterized protein n=1 Tax=Phytophthora rubi TaxID=129364 RepID=A0A6A4DB18_9STRA|nr:hypothetical protein PR003_g21573 [Phytophthora rubi]
MAPSRFLALLVGKGTAFVNAQVARKILLTPIDDGGPKKRKSLTIVTLCGGYLGYSVEKAPEIAYWSLQILQQAAIVLDYRLERESRDFSSMHSLVALFHGYQDLPFVRGIFSRLLRVSSPRDVALRKEVIEMLTLCLDHQKLVVTRASSRTRFTPAQSISVSYTSGKWPSKLPLDALSSSSLSVIAILFQLPM